jgi:hypothetical protein
MIVCRSCAGGVSGEWLESCFDRFNRETTGERMGGYDLNRLRIRRGVCKLLGTGYPLCRCPSGLDRFFFARRVPAQAFRPDHTRYVKGRVGSLS